MSQYYYMRAVYGWPDTPGERIHAFGDQKGAVTTNPFAAYQRQRLKLERESGDNLRVQRHGEMFAYWRLDRRMPWREALAIARTTPPERVCVLVGFNNWAKVDFVLPPGVLIEIDQYESTLRGSQAGVPRETKRSTTLPNFFLKQLPGCIRKIVDHEDYDPLGEYKEGYTHMVQYCHPVKTRDGRPSDTTLATFFGGPEVTPHEGGEVCINGVWVDVVAVDTATETDEDDGRTCTFYTAVVRDPSQRST